LSAGYLVLAGWAVAIVIMTALWMVQRVKDDAGVVDVGWAGAWRGIGLSPDLLAAPPGRFSPCSPHMVLFGTPKRPEGASGPVRSAAPIPRSFRLQL
jgi:hypothetical protein